MHYTIFIISIILNHHFALELGNYSKNNDTDTGHRIYRGYSCSTSEHGFMVQLLRQHYFDWPRICGGSLIKPTWVLTAAHCLSKGNDSYAVLVALNTQAKFILVKYHHRHPRFSKRTLENDIGLLRLIVPLYESNDIKYVSLPNFYEDDCDGDNYGGKMGLIMGWGNKEDAKQPDIFNLQCASIPIHPFAKCKKFYDYSSGRKIHRSQMCALSDEGIDACQGDSGGPLVCGSVQVGIISWGIGCATPYHPGIYTRVKSHLDFIDGTMRSNSEILCLSSVTIIIVLVVFIILKSANFVVVL